MMNKFNPPVTFHRLPKPLQLLIPWGPFFILLAWVWRANLFTRIPNDGDALEFIWGAQWYEQVSSLEQLVAPFYPLLFHPEGWTVSAAADLPAFWMK